MKALSLWQPWASLVAMEVKRIETRCWKTSYRGPMAIAATANLPLYWLGASGHSVPFQLELREVFGLEHFRDDHVAHVKGLPRGAVLCIVNLVDIRPTEEVRDDLSQRERVFGNYDDGRYAWFLEMVEKFKTPIPAKGNRLLWEWKRP